MNSADLIRKIKQIEGISQDERSYLINLVNTKKKYGLVWEDKLEAVEEQLRIQLPVLLEVVEKRILVKDIPNEEKSFESKQSTLFNELENHVNHYSDNVSPNHILIEGDNLHALMSLVFTHECKIDAIYIDPPYNTGNKDFKYNDSFVDREDNYRHSKWLSFMSKRLQIAKRLLSETGVIFISIDDNEQAQLKILCDEVFGEDNFIGNPVRRRRGSQANLSKNISTIHEYVLIYGKSSLVRLNNIKPQINISDYKNPDNDPRGPYVTMPCTNKGGSEYSITTPSGNIISEQWRFKETTFYKLKEENRLVYPRNGAGKPRYKLFLKEKEKDGVIDNSWWESIATNQEATIELKSIFSGNIDFNNPKPTGLINHILNLSTDKKDRAIILDFFAGSGTTLHSTMQLNAEDGGNRQCILVTNNENNICEDVTYERNRRIIQGYKNSNGEWVSGLANNNLRYYKCEYVGREPSLKNKRVLTLLATELLCIKEDCYTEKTLDFTFTNKSDSRNIRFFEENDKRMLVVYDDSAIETSIEIIKSIIANNRVPEDGIKVYVFSPGQYPFTEEFEEVLYHITLCALPDAIYKAFLNVLPKKKRESIPELEEDVVDSQPDLFE